MKKIILFNILSFILLVQGFAQQNYLDTIWSDGNLRTFRVYLPAAYDGQTPRPVVFLFHGVSMTSSAMEEYTSFRSVADTANFILITPDGMIGTFLPPAFGQSWNTIDFNSVDDGLFVSNLIDTLTGLFNIDTTRIYSAGFSNGGFMGYDLACRFNHRIAAIASVSGSIGAVRFPTCSPGRAVSIMQIQGTADPVILYEGGAFAGIDYMGIDTVLSYWIANNQCEDPPIETSLEDVNTTDGSTVVRYEYLNCANNEEIVLLKVIGGGHTWPGALGPDTNLDIIADQEIWRFFLKHQLPTASGTVEPGRFFEWGVFPNPASDFLNVSLSDDQRMEEIMIVDLLGKVVQLQRLETRDINTLVTIDLNGLPSGSYFLLARMEGQQTAIKRFVVMR